MFLLVLCFITLANCQERIPSYFTNSKQIFKIERSNLVICTRPGVQQKNTFNYLIQNYIRFKLSTVSVYYSGESCKLYRLILTANQTQYVYSRLPKEEDEYFRSISLATRLLNPKRKKGYKNISSEVCITDQNKVTLNNKPVIPILYYDTAFVFCTTLNSHYNYVKKFPKSTNRQYCNVCKSLNTSYILKYAIKMDQKLNKKEYYPILMNNGYNAVDEDGASDAIFDNNFYLRITEKNTIKSDNRLYYILFVVVINLLFVVIVSVIAVNVKRKRYSVIHQT